VTALAERSAVLHERGRLLGVADEALTMMAGATAAAGGGGA